MNLRTKSVAVAALLAFAALAGTISPASAGTSSGYVSGSGIWTDDMNDEGPISTSSHSHSNAAAMWQAILWADGYLTSTSKIDCVFGSGTRSATLNWQSDFPRTTADGVVGPATLEEAMLTHIRDDSTSSYLTLTYNGETADSIFTGRYVTFTRNTDGIWGMYIGSDHHLLSYSYANFNNCA